MRTHRWLSEESEDTGMSWTGTAITVLGAAVRWLIVLLAQHYGG